ncbi:DUF1611 domain-containing protein [Arthrobacter sp. GCM10027362]|uniref:DUF1611 domain-containing protein n=1 Tax=Arthrobacter sp. GCM10027362 TaxID=3273379 RepID=UPI00364382A0
MAQTLNPLDVAAGRSGMAPDAPVRLEPVPPRRLYRAKKAYTTRFLAERLNHSAEGFFLQVGTGVVPESGDVVLARVVRIGQHPKLESPASRRQALFIGDEILVPYGNRYAADQFLAKVPAGLDPCHLIAAGGVAGLVVAQHASMGQPTQIVPVGLLADGAGVLNLSRLAPHRLGQAVAGADREAAFLHRPPVIAVLGTSMNSGKSTVLSCLVKGLSAAGMTVAAAKATGTGSGNDPGMYVDAGAARVLDFTDFGIPTTFELDYGSLQAVFTGLVAALTDADTNVVLVEIADGVYQGETSRLLADPLFRAVVDRVVFTAADALGATAGLQVLRAADIQVTAVSGVLTSSPLAVREAAEAIDIPVLETVALCEPSVAMALLPQEQGRLHFDDDHNKTGR